MKIHELYEASYEGNLGLIEMMKFYQTAPEALKNKVEELLKKGDAASKKRVWGIVQKHLNVKLVGDEFESDLEESRILTEATFDLDKQVDFIYDNYFRDVVKNMVERDKFDVKTKNFSSKDLPSSKVIDYANKVNPVKIYCFSPDGGNAYRPPKKEIILDINPNAVSIANEMGGIFLASLQIGGRKGERFLKEFTEPRIKASIYHELSHWLDDTFHNRHIGDMIDKAMANKDPNIMKRGRADIQMTPYEMDAQIHSIKQLKRSNIDIWDTLSFDEMLELNPSLANVYDKTWRIDKDKEWKKMILRRMSREGLLGNSMKGSAVT